MKEKIIFLLIGPKGSGKSFIGTMMDNELGITFIRVEDWAKKIKKERQLNDQAYLNEVFGAIEKGVRAILEQSNKVVFESTGLSDAFDEMLKSLRQDFTVITIGIQADKGLCLERVKTRDQSLHIYVSDEQVDRINQQVIHKAIPTDFILINENKSAELLVREIKELLNKHSY